jgi:hypothetical protein
VCGKGPFIEPLGIGFKLVPPGPILLAGEEIQQASYIHNDLKLNVKQLLRVIGDLEDPAAQKMPNHAIGASAPTFPWYWSMGASHVICLTEAAP